MVKKLVYYASFSFTKILCFILFLILIVSVKNVVAVNENGVVFVIPIRGEITPAMAVFVEDNIEHANTARAQGIIIEISTLGGRADAAMGIKTAILESEVPVVVYIKDRAVSAGALIAISADGIIMAPGSHIGAAEPIPTTPKTVAAISAEFKGAAEANGRDPVIAAAMVDRNIVIPNLKEAGTILSLSAKEALEVDYADAVIYGREAVLKHTNLHNLHINEVHPDLMIRIAQFLTRSEIASLLLMIGMLAIMVEIFTAGFGIAGVIGITSFALYFGGGFLAGHTEWWPIMLFAVGLGLLIAEAVMPGFGVLGISGILVVLTSLVLAAPDPLQGITSVGTAVLATAVAIPLFGKIFGWSKLFNRFIMTEVLTVEGGNLTLVPGINVPEIGEIGVALTQLRPAGIAEFGEMRYDCVSDGEFIPSGMKVKVVSATASKIVVVKYNN